MSVEMQPVGQLPQDRPPVSWVVIWACLAAGFCFTGLVTYLVFFRSRLGGYAAFAVLQLGLVVPAAAATAAVRVRRGLSAVMAFGGSLAGFGVVFGVAALHLLNDIGGMFFSDG